MPGRIVSFLGLLVALWEPTRTAMVLPRPPSSPNHIRHDSEYIDRKIYEGKSIHGVLQNTNVERPDTMDYRLLEIELQSPDDMDAAHLQNLVHAMLKSQQTETSPSVSHPHPEVMPNSILGVRDMGLTPNFRMNTFEDDKRVLLSPPKLHSLDEKLYYLKNGRPKVYVNVRGHSGAFRKELVIPRPGMNDGQIGFLRVTRPVDHRQADWKAQHEKKARPPKKFDQQVHRIDVEREPSTKSIDLTKSIRGQAVAYGPEDSSTTESSLVTSSELPKQIPAPPSKVPARVQIAQTTPVQRYSLRRTDILPGYSFSEE